MATKRAHVPDMSLLEQFVWSVVVAIPVGWATIQWAAWRIPLGGRLPFDWLLLRYVAVLMWVSHHVLQFIGFAGDAAFANTIAQAAIRLLNEPRV